MEHELIDSIFTCCCCNKQTTGARIECKKCNAFVCNTCEEKIEYFT